ncbi:hypothetical protein [Sphingosinicella microcystinivorans]|uniref:hypothetical protein n=1 Tax=Sphingosinicella microcystinivorans TaxID=335406 RepID=UPI0022F3D06B|nr:hypothetical protein [Sphingosinicella microcystinivorans]WBX83855.1 hypothetical protein PE061_19040 [Sphingosinicella microcystinivorans]
MRKAFAGAMLAVAAFGATAAFAGDDARAQQRQVTRFEWKAPFTDMSPQGAAIIAEAMQAQRIPSNAEEVRKARQKVLDLISAEKLDIEAIRKAQAEERALAIKEHARAQEKMLKAYQRLSVQDRRAFAAGMREQEERMMQHLARARERMKEAQERNRLDADRMKREMEKMRKEMLRVTKETGSLWIVVPPPPVMPPLAPPEPVDPDRNG